MDSAVQAFKDEMEKKAAAKQKALAAVGRQDWEAVARYGITEGEEGKAFAAMQSLADGYVAAHPERFIDVAEYVTPEGNEMIVKMISLTSKAGMEERALELTMFELASFERQKIGVATRAEVRLVGKGN